MFDYYQRKTILVTGAAGFIGSHLVDKLLSLGATVIGVDNLLTGREENIVHLFEGGLEALKSLRDPQSPEPRTNRSDYAFMTANAIDAPLTYLGDEVKIDVIFHLASPASPPRYQAHPVETYLINSLGTHQLLDYLAQHHPKGRFVFASTSEVYGDPLVHPQPETYWGNVNPNGPRSCYDESKRLGETICGVFERDYHLDVRIMRIFNTYGPRMDPTDGRIIPNFINQALGGESLTIYGEGQQTRSFCYVDDLVEGIVRLGGIDDLSGQTINLGNPEEYTVKQAAEIISHNVGVLLKTENQDLPPDDPQQRRPDISKAKRLLAWKPRVSFNEGLQKTIAYFRDLKNIVAS